MKEIWKKIKNYEDYEVSNLGHIRSNKNGRTKMLKPSIWWPQESHKTNEKYMCVTLQQNGTRECFAIHRLVATSFVDNPNNHARINHKNGIKDDNRADNLEWCSQSENTIHSMYVLQKNRKYLERICQFDKKGNLIKVFDNVREAANETGAKHGNILKCANRERNVAGGFVWRFVGDERDVCYANKVKRGVVAISLWGERVKHFDSIIDASKWANVDADSISCAIGGKTNRAGGYMWRYLETYDSDEFSMFDNMKIREYTDKGTFIKEHGNIKDLITSTGYDLIKIKNVIAGKQKTAYRRIWELS